MDLESFAFQLHAVRSTHSQCNEKISRLYSLSNCKLDRNHVVGHNGGERERRGGVEAMK